MRDEKEMRLQELTPEPQERENPSDCDFCHLLCRTRPAEGVGDASSPHFMTERELRALSSMRRIKEEASSIKGRMKEMKAPGSSEDGKALSARLEELRVEWKKLDRERMDAAEERMKLLGHIQ